MSLDQKIKTSFWYQTFKVFISVKDYPMQTTIIELNVKFYARTLHSKSLQLTNVYSIKSENIFGICHKLVTMLSKQVLQVSKVCKGHVG